MSSCQKDYLTEGAEDQADLRIGVKDGRLFFPDIETFQAEYEKVKQLDDSGIYSKVSEFYNDDFIMLRPIVTDNNEFEIAKQLEMRELKLKEDFPEEFDNGIMKNATTEDVIEHIDDLEDIIGDEAFAAFLNGEAEIQIGDEIYKYTDAGLFITTDYEDLTAYLDSKNISKNLLIASCPGDVYYFITNEIPETGLTVIDTNLKYFRADSDREIVVVDTSDCTGGGGTTSGDTSGDDTTDSTSSSAELEAFVSALEPCNPSSGLFGGLFGTNKVCIDRYESKKRVKTKAFDYNYFIAFHLGVKVKHQKKGWTGIWRKQDTDEVGMIIERAQFKYDFTQVFGAALNAINQRKTFASPLVNVPTAKKGLYHYEVITTGAGYTFLDFDYSTTSPYPYDVFQDDLVIEYFGNNNIIDWALDQGDDQLTSEKLNEFFWNTAWSQTKSTLRGLASSSFEMPDDITFLSKHPAVGQLWVQKVRKDFGANRAEQAQSFDWGVGVSITLKESNGFAVSKANVGPYVPQQPDKFAVRMVGVAKRNGEWHGSLLEF